MIEIVKRPIDLSCNEEERQCDCGNDEFYECGATTAPDGYEWYNNGKDQYEVKRAKEYLEKCQKEPLPYKLFRLNELFGYTLERVGCEITEEQYMDRLEQLPPIPFKYDIYSGYIVPECITGNTYEHLLRFEGKWYCVIMEVQKKVMATVQNWW